MYLVKNDVKYSKTHEWVRVEGDIAYVGISDYASKHVGDVVFVDLPEVGTKVTKDTPFGAIESVKAVADLYSPMSGEVVAVNEALLDSPELLNEDSYENWIIQIKPTHQEETGNLLDSNEYAKLCEQ